MRIGFSTIFLDSLDIVQREYVLSKFNLFDISINQLGLFNRSKVLSVQSLFFGKDISGFSLLKDEDSFNKLFITYREIVDEISLLGYESLIFGAPSLRKYSESELPNKEDVFLRLKMLFEYAKSKKLILYMEALPEFMCDILLNHNHLLDLLIKLGYQKFLHIDFATMISNGETLEFLEKNVGFIKRYHISVPNYSYNFRDYPEIKDWVTFLNSKNIPGIIEIQNKSNQLNLIEEIEWLLKVN